MEKHITDIDTYIDLMLTLNDKEKYESFKGELPESIKYGVLYNSFRYTKLQSYDCNLYLLVLPIEKAPENILNAFGNSTTCPFILLEYKDKFDTESLLDVILPFNDLLKSIKDKKSNIDKIIDVFENKLNKILK